MNLCSGWVWWTTLREQRTSVSELCNGEPFSSFTSESIWPCPHRDTFMDVHLVRGFISVHVGEGWGRRFVIRIGTDETRTPTLEQVKKCSRKSVVFFLVSVSVSPYKQGKRVQTERPSKTRGIRLLDRIKQICEILPGWRWWPLWFSSCYSSSLSSDRDNG